MKKLLSVCLILAITSTVIYSSIQKSNESNNNFNLIEKASWLIGAWQSNSSKMKISEIWEKKNDSTYLGHGLTVIGKDTVSEESITIEQRGSQLSFNSTVKNQNNGQAATFMLTSSTNKQLVFENPEHDFPQMISYTLIANDSLTTEISGMVNGKLKSQKVSMTRVK